MKSVQDIRRKNLELVIEETSQGRATNFVNQYAQAYKSEGDGELTRAYVSQLKNARISFGQATARKLEKILGKPDYWFDKDHSDFATQNKNANSFHLVPIINWEEASLWNEAHPSFSGENAKEMLPVPFRHGGNAFILKVHGESMYNPNGNKSYCDGDFIVVDPDREPVHGCNVVIRLENESVATFKQLLIEPNGSYILKALNPNYPEPLIKATTGATIIGVVIGKFQEE